MCSQRDRREKASVLSPDKGPLGQRHVGLPSVGSCGFQRPPPIHSPSSTGGKVYNHHTLASECAYYFPDLYAFNTWGSNQGAGFKCLWKFCTSLAGMSGQWGGSNPFHWDSLTSPLSFEWGNSLFVPFFYPLIRFSFCSLIQKIFIESILPPCSSYCRHRDSTVDTMNAPPPIRYMFQSKKQTNQQWQHRGNAVPWRG